MSTPSCPLPLLSEIITVEDKSSPSIPRTPNLLRRYGVLTNSATTYCVLFDLLEVFAFLLPAFPSSIKVRLLVLYIYWVGHYCKLQYEYLKIKKTYTTIRTE